MTYKKFLIIGIILIFILLSPISLSSFSKCFCGGCCVGCPGDCFTVGFPLAYYYWGVNKISPTTTISQISVFGGVVDTLFLGIIIYFIDKKMK